MSEAPAPAARTDQGLPPSPPLQWPRTISETSRRRMASLELMRGWATSRVAPRVLQAYGMPSLITVGGRDRSWPGSWPLRAVCCRRTACPRSSRWVVGTGAGPV